MIIDIALGIVVLGSVVRLCWLAASGKGVRSRLGWIVAGAEAALLMIMARVLISWSVIPPLLWLVPIMIIAAAAVLVARRWSAIPWLRSDRKPATTITRSAIGLAFMGAVSALLLT